MSVSTLVVLALFASCAKDVKLTTDAIEDRSTIPVMDTRNVSTLVSDSGVVRYRITADSWQIYDKASPAYWEFPEGIYLEQFNPYTREPEAFLEADYAHYNRDDNLWHLRGHVKAKNLQAEEFDTPDLWWSQNEEKIWSDTSIIIHKATMTIYGVGFISNQDMTKYTITHPSGVIPVNE